MWLTRSSVRKMEIALDPQCFNDVWLTERDRGDEAPCINIYKPGSQVRGSVGVEVIQPVKCTGIYIAVQGEMCVAWNDGSSESSQEKCYEEIRADRSTKDYAADLSYLILVRKQLYGCDESQCIPAGDHHFPFTFDIPNDIPSSFKGQFGYIRYWIYVYIDEQSLSPSIHEEREIIIHGEYDLTLEPSSLMPFHEKNEDTYCCWCCKEGSYSYSMNLAKKAFSHGEIVKPAIQLENLTPSTCSAEIEMIRKTVYTVRNSVMKCEKVTLHSWKTFVAPQTNEFWYPEMEIRSHLPPSKLFKCPNISFQYLLKFTVQPKGCNCDSMSTSVEILIGNLPEPLQSSQTQSQEPPVPTDQRTFIHAPVNLTGPNICHPESQWLLEKGDNAPGHSAHFSVPQTGNPYHPQPSAPPIMQQPYPAASQLQDSRPPPPSYHECIQMATLSGASASGGTEIIFKS